MTGSLGRLPMVVRAIDDKASDTLVVVPGEGLWTGSSTLPHLHHSLVVTDSSAAGLLRRRRGDLVHVGSLTVGAAPSSRAGGGPPHLRREADESLCQIHHWQSLLSGRFAVQMDDGEYGEMEPNDVFDIPRSCCLGLRFASRGSHRR